ncbi:MAG: YdcF family protein [Bryobacterales bacterium]|nr:YdcF family protein [Bryobacterales bacterium]
MTSLEQPEPKIAGDFFRRRRRWLLAAALAALLLVLLVFRQQLLIGLGEFLVVSDPLERADVIYVLAGDFWGSRVLLGARLGSQGWAPKVILTGGRYKDKYTSDMAVDFAVQHGYRRDLFLPIRLEARSTIDEARAMKPIFQHLGAKRVLLVTSNFHSRRAALVFRIFVPEIDFRMEGSADHVFDPNAWWNTPHDRHLLFSEYQKIIGTFAVKFHLAGSDQPRQVSE